MKRKLLTFAVLGAAMVTANAQDNGTDNHKVNVMIPQIALLDIEYTGGSKDIVLSVAAPTEAGEGIVLTGATNNSLWLNYTSIVDKGVGSLNATRKVSVKISNGVVPGGLDLKVASSAASSDGKGTKGTPAGSALTLSSTDQDIITAIGSAWTGNGGGKGHQLTYSLAESNSGNDFNLLDNDLDNTQLTITYTISEN